ncbi:hypothetical protein GGI43DRAFT_217439 [Trichoderma evansii]
MHLSPWWLLVAPLYLCYPPESFSPLAQVHQCTVSRTTRGTSSGWSVQERQRTRAAPLPPSLATTTATGPGSWLVKSFHRSSSLGFHKSSYYYVRADRFFSGRDFLLTSISHALDPYSSLSLP